MALKICYLVILNIFVRCVAAIGDVVKDLPVLAFNISLENSEGIFAVQDGVDINMIVSVVNSMGTKFTAKLK